MSVASSIPQRSASAISSSLNGIACCPWEARRPDQKRAQPGLTLHQRHDEQGLLRLRARDARRGTQDIASIQDAHTVPERSTELRMVLVNDGLLLVCIQAEAAGHPEGPFAVVEQDDHRVRRDIDGKLLSHRLRQGF
jgi:hypothetical protein